MVVFKNFVEAGRIILFTHGPQKGKIAMIVEIIDQNRVLCDGPHSGVPRKPYNLKSMMLTSIKCKIFHGSGTNVVQNVWKKEKVDAKWKASSTCKKLEKKKKRETLTDFERFKVRYYKKKCSAILNKCGSQFSKNKSKKPAAKSTKKPVSVKK